MKIRDSGMPPENYWQTLFNVELILEKLLINEKITDAAEFGSGYGTFSIPAAKRIKGNLFALDIEDEMLRLLNKKNAEKGIQNIKVIKTDFMKHGTGLQNNSVDYVMLFNILHAEEPVQLLNESLRILKPGGKAGIIHWIYSDETPRGPSLNIRPKPEQCVNWLIKSGFKIFVEPVSLPPYHYGLVGIK
jgi:ubiquinone/menaquinone biosynthesis C-methylase UbiE